MSTRQALHRERIVNTAVEILDRGGLKALTMRGLARELGFEVMSLYNHVAGRDDVLAAAADRVTVDILGPAPVGAWRDRVRAISRGARATVRAHPWLAQAFHETWPGPHRWRYFEAVLVALQEAGLSDRDADLGFHALRRQFEAPVGALSSPRDVTEAAERARHELAAFPLMTAHLDYHEQQRDLEPVDEDAFVVELILDGLSARADRPHGQ